MDEYVSPPEAAGSVPPAAVSLTADELLPLVGELAGSDYYRPALSFPGVQPFLASFVAEHDRPRETDAARRRIRAVADLYVAGIALALPRLGLRDDPLAHAVLQAVFRANPGMVVDRQPRATEDRQVTSLLEASYGWRARGESFSRVEQPFTYWPGAVSERIAGHLLFDGKVGSLAAAVDRAQDLAWIASDLGSWLGQQMAGRTDRVAERIKKVFKWRAFARAADEGRLVALDLAQAKALAVAEIDRSIAENARGTGYATDAGSVRDQDIYHRLIEIRGRIDQGGSSGGAGAAHAGPFGGVVEADGAASTPPADADDPVPADRALGGAAALTGVDDALLPVPVGPAPGRTPVR